MLCVKFAVFDRLLESSDIVDVDIQRLHSKQSNISGDLLLHMTKKRDCFSKS